MRLVKRNFIRNMVNSALAITAGECPSTLFTNEWTAANATDSLRWVNLAPYGDWPNVQGVQRFQKSDADNIVNHFNSALNTPQRLLGLPWYVGHPDHPAFANKYADTKAYGRIKKLEARDDGLWAGVKFNNDGETLISNESFHGHSTNWFLKQDGADKKFWRPFKLKSVGFTNEPNIPVDPVTTANEEFKPSVVMEESFKRVAYFRLVANAKSPKPEDDGNYTECAACAAQKSTAADGATDAAKDKSSHSTAEAANATASLAHSRAAAAAPNEALKNFHNKLAAAHAATAQVHAEKNQ